MLRIKIGQYEVQCDTAEEALKLMNHTKKERVATPTKRVPHKVWTESEVKYIASSLDLKPLIVIKNLHGRSYSSVTSLRNVIKSEKYSLMSAAVQRWVKEVMS